MKSRICFLYLQSTKNDRESSKRKRQKSLDSEQNAIPSVARPKTKKLAKSPNSEQREDGEISDDYDDSEDDSNQARSKSPVCRRKQIVYDIDDEDDDDYYSSSNSSGRSSPQNFSGEQIEK